MDINIDNVYADIQINHLLRAISTFLLCGSFFISLSLACDKCNAMLQEHDKENDMYEGLEDKKQN